MVQPAACPKLAALGPVGGSGPADGDAGVYQPAAAVPAGRRRLLADPVSVLLVFFPSPLLFLHGDNLSK